MADSKSPHAASLITQTNALFRKNLTFQKRKMKSTALVIAFPILLCLFLFELQRIANKIAYNDVNKERCMIDDTPSEKLNYCPIPNPPSWPPLLQTPPSQARAVRTRNNSFPDLPDKSCKTSSTHPCPVTVLLTGADQSFGNRMAGNLFNTGSVDLTSSGSSLETLANLYLGTDAKAGSTNFVEQTFLWSSSLYTIQQNCGPNSTVVVPFEMAYITSPIVVTCVESLRLWRQSSLVIKDEILKGYQEASSETYPEDIFAAYDFLDSNENKLNVNIWYNSHKSDYNDYGLNHIPGLANLFDDAAALVRVPRSVNVVSNAYLQLLRGAGVKMLFEFVKEMPRPHKELWSIDVVHLVGPLLFTWTIMQLFPVMVTSLVYEKQQNLRIMMKMHGLGDVPYWIISYAYFFFLSLTYMFCLVLFGSLLGLKFFTMNSYSIQFIFYFIYINLQIIFAFLAATIFSSVKTATVIVHIYIFATGLIGATLFQGFIEETSFSSVGIVLLQTLPCFSLYRGLYEFGQAASAPVGMVWKDTSENGMRELFVIMLVEWFIVLLFANYFDQVASVGSGIRKHPLFFLKKFQKKSSLSSSRPSLHRQESELSLQMEKFDVSLERKKVEQLRLEPSTDYAVICDDLKKIYPGSDGNPEKIAVRGLSLALPEGQCFGMLGPNGAGKTTSINMMIGLMNPTSGTTFVHGLDTRRDMDKIYTSMGVCPQHDLLWETLTGREHLLFYGRLKNLKGAALTQAVENSLKAANIFDGGVGDKQAGKYSGGMKRRLSVAMSLIGHPKVVYMDEPSSGLDPASKKLLWDVVKQAKQNCAIILTTHSMEEADILCDRLGIFVDGSLQCIGYPTELKARYGGSYVFTITTSQGDEQRVENLVKRLSPSANKVYHMSGTQKYELQKNEVKLVDVLRGVEEAKCRFRIHDWGLADTTLEDVFIKVAKQAEAVN